MSGIKPKKVMKSHTFKVLRYFLAAIGVSVCLAAIVLLSLPSVISSDWTRGLIERQLAKATGKPASLENLSFSWTEGLRLQALQIGTGPLDDPQFLASLQDLHADFGLAPLLRGDLHLLLELRGLRLRLAHAEQQEPAPPPKPMPDVLREAFSALRGGLTPRPLDLDAHLRVDLSDMDVRIEPAPEGKPLELHHISFFLEAKRLKDAPVTVKAGLNIAKEDSPPIPVRLAASLAGLKDTTGRLNPAQANLDVMLDAPGLELLAVGSLTKGLKVELKSQLGEAQNAVRPLLPPAVPELDGAMALTLAVTQTVPDRLDLGLTIRADAVRAANGALGDKAAGPISLKMLQAATLDLKAETASLSGSLEIKPTSQLRWVAGIDGVAEGKPRATFSMTETRLVLNELLPSVRAFLPPGLSLGQAELALDSLNLTAALPPPGDKQDINVSLKGLKLAASKLSRRASSGQLSIGQAHVLIDSASLTLPGASPGRAEASITASADTIRLPGATPAVIRSFSLPRLVLQAEALSQNASALFGIAGNAALELDAQAHGIEAKGRAAVPSLTAEVRLRAGLPDAKSASINLLALNLDAPLVRVLQPRKKTIELPLILRASAPEITLSGAELTPGLHNLALNLNLGQALQCEAQASLAGPAGRDLSTQGTLSLDAQKTLALTSSFAPRKTKASGALSVDWKLAAVLPGPAGASKDIAKPQKTIKQSLKELDFLHILDATLKLDSLSLDLPLAAAPGQEPETLRLRGFTTPKPLRITVREGVHEASLTGTLAFGPMDSLPGVGKLSKPLRGLFTVNAAQQDARSIQLSQLLHLDGLDLDQNLSLTLDKLDTVLDRDQDRLAAVLEQVDGNVSFSLTSGLSALPPSTGAKGLSGSGRLEAGAEARLSGGRSLALSARLLSPGIDLHLGPDFAVEGLSSTLRVSRRYRLLRGLRCPGEQEQAGLPLSEQVFDLFPSRDTEPSATGGVALGQLLRPDTSRTTAGAFGLARLRLKSGGLPLDIHDIRMQLDDSGPVPGLRSFRAGLLGGNVLGSAMLRKSAGRYSLDADLAFTGIDPARLLPEKTPRDLGALAETSGRVSLSVPLTPDPEELLRRLSFRADITKIGPRTLERMLYALDPEEQNETIVQQRRLMGIGYPRNLRIAAAYGNLSLSGAVDVKGFQLDLPPVDRLGIANLPFKKQLSKPLAAVPGLIKILDAASGSLICRAPSRLPATLRVVEPASQGVSR
jgi:translocation and assembly module TamB